jgi:hypothetical protein
MSMPMAGPARGWSFLTVPAAFPVILFSDGSACTNINFVLSTESAAVDQQHSPGSWTKWKEENGKIALLSGSRYTFLDFQLKYPPLSPGSHLAGTFTRLTGGGNTAVGGSVLIVAQTQLYFDEQGRFVIGALTGVTGSGFTFADLPPDRQGTYEIDGYSLELHFEDGKSERTSIVYSPSDPGLVYVGGRSYVVLD